MSTAVLEPIVEKPVHQPTLVAVPAAEAADPQWSDPHPLLPVFVAGAISAVLSVVFIGSVLIWLAVRHSGIVAP